MSTTHTIHTPINDFIAEDVRRTGIFEDLEIDACCGGWRTLAQACEEKGIDPEPVLQQLLDIQPEPDPSAEEAAQGMDGSLAESVDHLLTTHHTYLKQALPKLAQLFDKVIAAHGENHPELKTIQETFAQLRADLEPHLLKEEQVLFPIIKVLETSGGDADFHCGSVLNPIRAMQTEHERTHMLFEKIRGLSGNFKLPEDACESYRRLYAELDELETDTRLHIRKENEILFPQVLA
ncbi:MAG: iron-sulfur cluster repair di-iron protein, partial [Nitrospinaceae bacterium]|nr:iron-sulfur cluster repair di-iron protein [Nitrospinaceae bacterium]NIR54381.1 iron-sulfur cluster repair di-iron protein [Nitrospinaceae bacterium]NIS84794.1 iron-sulfur cluster repair di-iron protein [Nitrospinaceae bacterium]NIT81600.1 iron-sulfur cluster repair di-iron protein [Nitrospinaceae bacterium]NIU43882.1 iron-sulfur cluster repair di-iron protein [Nitrospinaceae bacterium]